MLGVRFPDGPRPDLAEKLAANKVYVSLRGDSIRISPYLYNDEADIDRLFAALDRRQPALIGVRVRHSTSVSRLGRENIQIDILATFR